jgi:hypothetical protein
VVFLALRPARAFTIRNDWSQRAVVVGLVTLGLAQGCIVALVFNKLLMSNPKELAWRRRLLAVPRTHPQHLGPVGGHRAMSTRPSR